MLFLTFLHTPESQAMNGEGSQLSTALNTIAETKVFAFQILGA